MLLKKLPYYEIQRTTELQMQCHLLLLIYNLSSDLNKLHTIHVSELAPRYDSRMRYCHLTVADCFGEINCGLSCREDGVQR